MKHIAYKRFLYVCIVAAAAAALASSAAFSKEQAESSDQQIDDFSLAGYGDKGKKSWDLAGKTADVFTDVVKLKKVTGNLYGESEDVQLSADRGDFNKKEGTVHLEDNVVITTSSGARLTTDSMDWDRKNKLVTTKDIVNIVRQDMVTVAEGARGEPGLKRVTLEKNVRVNMNTAEAAEEADADAPATDTKGQMVITCDGPMEIDYEKNIAIFRNNVLVDRTDSKIYSDILEIYYLAGKASGGKQAAAKNAAGGASASPAMGGTKIDKIVARGNVKIIRGENTSYSDEAIYTARDKKITLLGKPKLVLYSTEDLKGLQ